VHVLPDRDECVEAFQWLGQEVEQAKGSALVMHVERFEGVADSRLIDLFRQARTKEYRELDATAAKLERAISSRRRRPQGLPRVGVELERLRRWQADIARIDFFDCPEGVQVTARLSRIARSLSSGQPSETKIARVAVASYRNKRWVTRPHPHVDRLACIWLIRRFIDPDAVVRYAGTAEPGEVAFDMQQGEFGHRGNLCTFEVMIKSFNLDDPGLRAVAEIVHEIDLRDGRYARPEAAGIDAILKGWVNLAGGHREAHGTALFEGLYTALSKRPQRQPEEKNRKES
jgi:hypothetical protein